MTASAERDTAYGFGLKDTPWFVFREVLALNRASDRNLCLGALPQMMVEDGQHRLDYDGQHGLD